MTIEKKVSRYAVLLDLFEPDWFTRVHPGSLNINNDRNCVLGQVYGDYFSAPARRFRFLAGVRPAALAPSPFMSYSRKRRRRMEDAWVWEITERRYKRASAVYDERARFLRKRAWVRPQPLKDRKEARVGH